MRSIFLWRMLLVLFVTLLCVSLLMAVGYMYFSRDALTDIKLNEMLPKAKVVRQLYWEYDTGNVSKDGFERLSDELTYNTDTTVLITDASGDIVYLNDHTLHLPESDIGRILQREITSALAGHEIVDTQIKLPNHTTLLGVGIPMYGEDQSIIGSVLILKTPAEIARSTSQLNQTLILIILVILPLALLVAMLGVRRIAEPLHRMAEVAIEMSKGNFEIRAEESEIGEVGLLSRAMNHLCETLSQTIYQLQTEKSQLNEILLSFSEGIAATDSLGCLTLYNPALMRMFGAVHVNTRTELIKDQTIWNAFDQVFQDGEPQTLHYAMPGDRMIWITLSPVKTENGVRTGVVGLFKDMTEIERLERTRREYVANVSHELRTPLTAVRGLLEPLCDGLVTSEADQHRYYKIMLREVLRLSRLISDMMELSRLQSGSNYMELQEIDINELLDDILQSYEKEAQQHGIALVLDAPTLPHVLTDSDRIEQILIILLDNAMRYTPAGGTITLRATDGQRVNISVIDTGCGIPQEDLPHIFDRFYKVDKSRKEGGTGLGLSIAKFIIDKLDEKVLVESTPGKGTCFTFTLKKYVHNAIPLGPARESWQPSEPAPAVQVSSPSKICTDAPYEVLNKPEKPNKEARSRQTNHPPENKDHKRKKK